MNKLNLNKLINQVSLKRRFKNKKYFDIKNYFKMYRARGFRLVFEYFIHNHLFDIFNGTDTHAWERNKLSSKFGDSEIYMVSWSKDVKESSLRVENFLGTKNLDNCNLIDLGSGKGKVLITWRELYPHNEYIYGIEYDKKLNRIAKENFKKLKYKKVKYLCSDISTVKIPDEVPEKTIVYYMFNPCGKKTLINFFKNNRTKNSFVIYFNPVFHKDIKDIGYKLVFKKSSYRKGSTYSIFYKK